MVLLLLPRALGDLGWLNSLLPAMAAPSTSSLCTGESLLSPTQHICRSLFLVERSRRHMVYQPLGIDADSRVYYTSFFFLLLWDEGRRSACLLTYSGSGTAKALKDSIITSGTCTPNSPITRSGSLNLGAHQRMTPVRNISALHFSCHFMHRNRESTT